MFIWAVIFMLIAVAFVFIYVGIDAKDGTRYVTDFAAWVFFIIAIGLIVARLDGQKW